MEFTLKLVTSEVNKVIRDPNPSSIELTVKFAVIGVIHDIGISKLCKINEIPISIVKNKARIPADYVGIIDLFDEHKKSCLSIEISEVGISSYKHSFYRTPFELIFPNMENGKIILKYYSFYTNESGDMIIPDNIFSACVQQGIYKCLDTAPNNLQYRDRLVFRNTAEQEIAKARGNINSYSEPQLRNMRRLFS